MIYRALLAAVLACVAAAAHPSFEDFVAAYSKPYSPGSSEWLRHKKLYYQELDRIDKHNRAYEAGMISFKLGVNKFSDLDDKEMGAFMGFSGVRSSLKQGKNLKGVHKPGTVKQLAPSLNWVEKGAVGPVRDQGSCGSCWAHAAGAEIESHLAINEGFLTDLSVQQLVDCAPNDNHCGGIGGCQGSTTPLAFDYLIDAGGMSIEWAYPYVDYWYSREPAVHKCSYDHADALADGSVGAVLDGYVVVEDNNYDAMMEAINIGPVSINVAASAWKSYAGGVFDGCSYDDIIVNHVVQLVGYGTDEETGLDYWLVKNSWGPFWGEEGYIRLRRHNPYKGEEIPCGPDTRPQDGTECEDGPEEITVCGPCGMFWQAAYPVGVRRP